jgi:hypothetical protein
MYTREGSDDVEESKGNVRRHHELVRPDEGQASANDRGRLDSENGKGWIG